MKRSVSVVLLAACAASPAPPPRAPAPPPSARIEVTGTCPEPSEANARIARVLATHGAQHADLVVAIAASAQGETTTVQLRIARQSGGDAGLDRGYTFAPGDCASAAEVLALGVDRFLTSFPDWAGPAPAPPPPPPAPVRWTEVAIVGAASGIWMPLGVDAHAGALADLGDERHRFGGSLRVRASVPQAAGNGQFQQTALLAGLGYRFSTAAWRVRGELRGGALLVTGMGLTENASDWLPWGEGAVFGGRAFTWGSLGIEVAASWLRHRAVTRDGLVSEDIPLLRLGFAGELGVWSQK